MEMVDTDWLYDKTLGRWIPSDDSEVNKRLLRALEEQTDESASE